uniref:Homologous-pairing protein 2 winged helix domain-containing protein n=1 Tax=Octactis speculum TaxID=3111310 RepID=A0A7S2BRA0_9STRA|mmetsp:Transcript_26226/g.36063  ORF Transcript_26226/g.36063 Transcript_26226/m.36063 type:complete len:287 (+) Transcript_26226:24-884(+)
MDRRMSVESNSDASFCDLGCSEIDEDDEEQDFSEEPSTQEDSDDGDFEKPVRARVISQSSNKRKSQVLSSSRTASKEKKAPSVVCRVDGKNIEKPSNLDEAHIGSVEETRKPEILIPTGTKADPGSSSTQSKLGGGKDPPKKPKISISNEIKSKMKGTSAKAQVLKALYNRNRPMNATNITDLLGQKVPKGVVQSTLEDLSRSGDASVKEYGKAKVYWFNQAHLPKVSQKDLDDTKKSIEEFMDQCSDLRSRARSLEQEAGSLEASPTDIELEKLLNDEQEEEAEE